MSDVINIQDLKNSAIENMDIEQLRSQNLTLQNNLSKIMAENIVLKQQLGNKYSEPSNEELVCIEQIRLMKLASDLRELSLDEVKRLDLLVKNLKMLKDSRSKDKDIDFDSITEEELVAIASNKSK